MKQIVLFFLLFTLIFQAQSQNANWEDLFSYYSIQDISTGGGKVFAAAENSVFSYRRGTQEIEKISSIQGLSSEKINTIYYSANYNLLFIGYKTGLMDVYNPQDKTVLKVVDIIEKVTITPANKQINHFYEYENKLFISTNYGISEFRLNNLEFGDTFFIGDAGEQLQVAQTTVLNDKIYAATQEGGVRFADVNSSNLVDFSLWQNITNNSFRGVVTLNNTLYVINNNNSLQQLQGNNFINKDQFNEEIKDFRVNEEKLIVTTFNKVKIYNNQLSTLVNISNFNDFSPNLSSATIFQEVIYLGDLNEGLLAASTNNTSVFRYLSPDGPLRNDVFGLSVIPNELWVTYGEYNGFLDPYPLNSRGVSHLKNDEWINISYEDLGEKKNFVRTAINPSQTNQVYISSMYDGLLEVNDEELVQVYDQTNSGLQEAIRPAGTIVQNDVRVNGIAFDRDGNLWGNVSLVEKGMFKLNAGGGFQFFDTSEIVPDYFANNLGFTELIIDNAGNIFFGTSKDGLVGFQPSTNTFAKVSGNETTGNIPDNFVRSLALDNNNQLWLGTSQGLRVLFGPSGMFDNPNTSANEIIILDDDGVAQELLAGSSISAITVDGNNNKWIATEAGAFYLSSNGQETIYRFTKENSPLPSNSVTDIEIDEVSGKVYIGTRNGLVAFRGTATSSSDTFEKVRAFPNPVRPGYSGLVTIDGLREGANVKITDIEGNLVHEVFSEGGSVQWDSRAFGKHKVASGVYMVLITSKDQLETKVTKIMVIR
ncbi:two-component regulator propeller domain-containing protein [Mesonia ostreae]|uniref:Two-component regulator propeller domain-containing protein n=1 Tax=Mesonia ostreae TaxID=861110 RepID=A0ABU2KIH9_9FLAO|nr:two-component regulator propeller domain-containing protein [Mesonia ostreae]MDT0294521.1 two-component regulator propeller domain-containing protein [Mesonia ostreae]